MNGSIIIVITAVLWSTAGLFVKSIPWSAFAIASFRAFFAVTTLCVTRCIRRRKELRKAAPGEKLPFEWKTLLPKVTRPNLMVALAQFSTSALYMAALKLTTAANAIVLQYLEPVLVLLYGIVVLHEKPRRSDLILTAVIFGGCVMAFAGQLSADGFTGNVLAVLSAFTFAGQIITSRHPDADPVDGMIIGCSMSLVLFLPFLLAEPASTWNAATLLNAVGLGVLQYALANLLFSIGIRKVSSLNASLILTLEPVLNPVWVFLFLGEAPSLLSLCGLICVVGALIVQSLLGKKTNDHAEEQQT